jgi:hypothetical protein
MTNPMNNPKAPRERVDKTRERVHQAREKEKIRARRDQRVTYDLPPALRKRIKALAGERRLPASQLVTLALLRFLNDYAAGKVPLEAYQQPSASNRYDWNLVFPEELWKVLQDR